MSTAKRGGERALQSLAQGALVAAIAVFGGCSEEPSSQGGSGGRGGGPGSGGQDVGGGSQGEMRALGKAESAAAAAAETAAAAAAAAPEGASRGARGSPTLTSKSGAVSQRSRWISARLFAGSQRTPRHTFRSSATEASVTSMPRAARRGKIVQDSRVAARSKPVLEALAALISAPPRRAARERNRLPYSGSRRVHPARRSAESPPEYFRFLV